MNFRTPSKSFQDLIVWQKAHQCVLDIYRFTDKFPQKEICGLTSQIRRSAVSIPANIAEGFRKKGRADKTRFLNISEGSLEEIRYYLILAHDLHYGDSSELILRLKKISKLLYSYSKSISNVSS